jgi:hypothetical protein
MSENGERHWLEYYNVHKLTSFSGSRHPGLGVGYRDKGCLRDFWERQGCIMVTSSRSWLDHVVLSLPSRVVMGAWLSNPGPQSSDL